MVHGAWNLRNPFSTNQNFISNPIHQWSPINQRTSISMYFMENQPTNRYLKRLLNTGQVSNLTAWNQVPTGWFWPVDKSHGNSELMHPDLAWNMEVWQLNRNHGIVDAYCPIVQ